MLSFLQVALQESILYFFYTLLAKQEKVSRPPGRDPASALNKNSYKFNSYMPR